MNDSLKQSNENNLKESQLTLPSAQDPDTGHYPAPVQLIQLPNTN